MSVTRKGQVKDAKDKDSVDSFHSTNLSRNTNAFLNDVSVTVARILNHCHKQLHVSQWVPLEQKAGL